jgi:micrococcal nuclease
MGIAIGTTGLLFLAGCKSSPPSTSSIQVHRVISGQSIEWIDRSEPDPVVQTGRLIGIDAPDLAQEPWGKQAQQRLEALLKIETKSHLRVEVDRSNPDRFGRKFIYLWKDGGSINEQLVREGLVLADPRHRGSKAASSTDWQQYSTRLIDASQYARLTGKGIWNPDLPLRTLPADFRREQR